MSKETIKVPDIGGTAGEVVELCVAVGDPVKAEDSLVVLESEKASVEIPSPLAGTVESIMVKVGDSLSQGDSILTLEVSSAAEQPVTSTEPSEPASSGPSVAESVASSEPAVSEPPVSVQVPEQAAAGVSREGGVYAGPAVRKLARELDVNLSNIRGTGEKGRVVKEDLHAFVKQAMVGGASQGTGIPAIPDSDYASFGEVSIEPLTNLHKAVAANMTRNWLNVPHVTQFDEADVTDLEDFRHILKAESESRSVRLTPLPFLLKACAAALVKHPTFNVSLMADGQRRVFKHYVHIGVAVDTGEGLVVPVIRDVDKKSLWELAAEVADWAKRAKAKQLQPADMRGGCFTVSSLGQYGGQGFTPIVNAPEVAILGVAKLSTKPVWDGQAFQPRKMLPLTLSYDHRAINGAEGGRFFNTLLSVLEDVRRLLL